MFVNGSRSDGVAREIFARGLLQRAKRRNIWGDFEASRSDLNLIADLEKDAFPLSPALIVEYLTVIGDVALGVSGYDTAGHMSLKRALNLAQVHGLGRRSITAGCTLAGMQAASGETVAAENLTRLCLDVAVDLAMVDLIVEVALDAAGLPLLRREWKPAGPFFDVAKKYAAIRPQAIDDTVAIRLKVAHADWLLLSGKVGVALRQARAADRAAAALGSDRLRGGALRVMAEAEASLGRRIEATETVHKMLSALEKHGSRGSLTLALNVATRITGNPEYKARAAEYLA
jgi:hypothetical protein